jgi:Ca2+-binding EF-hand superfamily protein
MHYGETKNVSAILFAKLTGGIDRPMTLDQFKQVCHEKAYDVEEVELESAFVDLDVSGDGTIQYDEFKRWFAQKDFVDHDEGMDGQEAMVHVKSDEDKEQMMKVKESFKNVAHGDRAITADELQILVYKQGYCLSDEEVETAMGEMDKDASGTIQFIEYLRWFKKDGRFEHLQKDDDEWNRYAHTVTEYFRKYDSELSGYLSREQFGPLYTDLKTNFEMPELETALNEIDCDHDQRISLNEFLRWYVNYGA